MARTLRWLRSAGGALPLLALWALPLLMALAFAMTVGLDATAWRSLQAHPQLWPALMLSIFTGVVSTALALLCALTISAGFYHSRLWHKLQAASAVGMALPHLAFATGVGFLIMPSGWLARLFVGGATPPQWVTTQDPLGLSLLTALALKEVPFLFALIWSMLVQGGMAENLVGQVRAARSLGHGAGSIWLRVVQPQILRRLLWPLLIVFSYGASVVDMALVIGPTQPPPLAVVVWQDLNHAETAINARGLAGAIFMTLALIGVAAMAALAANASQALMWPLLVAGPSLRKAPVGLASTCLAVLALIFLAVVLVLAVVSVAPRWPYPLMWPAVFSFQPWVMLLVSSSTLWLSLGLAMVSSLVALVLVVLWFETQSQRHDRWLLGFAALSLALPQLLVAAGQYRLLLSIGLTGGLAGLFLVHLAPVLAYVAVVLTKPYRALDPRYSSVAASLSATPLRRCWQIKLPLLKAPLLTAAAVGFAVSMVQFVPAQLVAAGRYETLPMAAVTLSSGGNRSLSAVFALALALPPLLAFLIAALAARPRWR